MHLALDQAALPVSVPRHQAEVPGIEPGPSGSEPDMPTFTPHLSQSGRQDLNLRSPASDAGGHSRLAHALICDRASHTGGNMHTPRRSGAVEGAGIEPVHFAAKANPSPD